MKTLIKILFIIFLIWIALGFYFLHIQHEKAEVIMGLAVLFLSFILMPIFIYYRYKDGKYKKYIINDEKLRDAFNKVAKK